jgi:tetrahydromethanopterin S-methyltransferase subunit A
MYKPWARTDTKDFIHRVESRLEDFDYYLKRTVEWCENNGVFENKRILMCCLISCIWVSSMREEQVSFQEIVELVGLEDFEDTNLDKIYNVCEEFRHLEHEEILELLISKTGSWDGYFPS